MNLRYFLLIFTVLSGFMLSGCVGTVASLTASATQSAIRNIEFEDVDVKANIAQGITPEQLAEVKYVAVMLRERKQSSNNDPAMRANALMSVFQGSGNEDTMTIFADSFSTELMSLGYKVMERDQLSLIMSEKGLEAAGVAENEMSSLSSLRGVDALVILNAQTTNKTKYSMFGGAKLNSVIKTATARVISVQSGEMIMTVNLDYKNGQDSGSAAQTMAKALKIKLHGEETEATAQN
ncbi:hypothetical protein EP073_01245 [Geovibrio thiophilus]|uniref:Uncharacterized protein n=1 Tax=Geovibrio thiophilus TaxID=139438 RepID=A0A410JVK5_9BACT|nr:CsgG/HfaB family protein [Geovibrio thiophilus]QAR32075.1 hypothetical protein EP073_01245 [Geovibrio thiophilus]